MNTKKLYLCMTVLMYNIAIFGTEPEQQVVDEQDITVLNYQPKSFTDQMGNLAISVAKNMTEIKDFFSNAWSAPVIKTDIVDGDKKIVQMIVPSVTHNSYPHNQTIKSLWPQKKQHVIIASVVCVVAMVIAYKYVCLSSKDNFLITEEEIKELVECVIRDPLVAQHDQLNKVFELLLRNGLEDIVIYNDHMFEINNYFRVEINGKHVKVSRC